MTCTLFAYQGQKCFLNKEDWKEAVCVWDLLCLGIRDGIVVVVVVFVFSH